jgi:hypothetical protein
LTVEVALIGKSAALRYFRQGTPWLGLQTAARLPQAKMPDIGAH